MTTTSCIHSQRGPAAPFGRLLLTTCIAWCLAGCPAADLPEAAFSQGSYAHSLASARSLAERGQPAAANLVGIHYYLGAGVARDFATAAQWFERAARDGDADAQRNLATLYLRGWGVRQDDFLAYAWFSEAAERGNSRARAYLGVMGDALTPNQIVKARRALDGEIGQRRTD